MPGPPSSPPALRGVVPDRPGRLAGVTRHQPITRVRAVLNLQDELDQSRIGRIPMLALRRVTHRGRVQRVEPSTTVGVRRLVDVFLEELPWDAFAESRVEVHADALLGV